MQSPRSFAVDCAYMLDIWFTYKTADNIKFLFVKNMQMTFPTEIEVKITMCYGGQFKLYLIR